MGIDYGRGLTNIDPETGIRYGIIPMNKVNYPFLEDFVQETVIICPACNAELKALPDENKCTVCLVEQDDFDMFYPMDNEAPSHYVTDKYNMMLDSHGDIWIFKSPYKAKAGFCSPCAPGAVYLTTSTPDAYGYCLPDEWFFEGEAPYKYEEV